jgi:hypothetical protein
MKCNSAVLFTVAFVLALNAGWLRAGESAEKSSQAGVNPADDALSQDSGVYWGPVRQLFHADSLAGWRYGPSDSEGWTLSSGRLVGKQNAKPLLSGFTFGEFDLQFAWSVGKDAVLAIRFPEVPRQRGLTLTLREGDRGVDLTDGSTTLLHVADVAAVSHGDHTARVARRGKSISLEIDGRSAGAATLDSARRFGLGLAVEGRDAQIAGLSAREPLGKPLFNEKDLSEWWAASGLAGWSVENGQIALRQGKGDFLRTRKKYANFTLSLEYRMGRDENSGVGIRTPHDGWPSREGMELQLLDQPADKPCDRHATASIYGNVPPLARTDRSMQWNSIAIKADGRMVSAWVNGALVQQACTADHPELKHRPLEGWVGLQDHGALVRFRKLRILTAPDGLGLDAWHVAPPRRAGAALVDRIMNPDTLACDDGIRSSVATAVFADKVPGSRVLADLKGPGAIVRMARATDAGTLAFYFDGESSPRIVGKPSEIVASLPTFCENRNPALVCLTYAKSLKIVLRDAAQGRFRFDCVTFPQDYAIASYLPRESGLPRGWLEAARYRAEEQLAWGVHREVDRGVRLRSPQTTVQPGESATLVKLAGAGVVQWIRLDCDKKLLQDKSLWLEVRVDGQSEPAVAAPIRFWFPGVAHQGNYPNYLFVDHGGAGATVILPMPFGDGIAFSAVNRGTKPIAVLGMTVSGEMADKANAKPTAPSMRLRGIYQAAGQNSGEFFRQVGAGRWVGIVCEKSDAVAPFGSLAIDGQPAPKGMAPGDGLFFGQEKGDFRSALSGRDGSLSWRYLLIEPVDFKESLALKAAGEKAGASLALFYMAQ